MQKDLSKHLGINLTLVGALEQFLNGLKGIKDPEQKRKFIGGKYIDIFEAEARTIEEAAANSDRLAKLSSSYKVHFTPT